MPIVPDGLLQATMIVSLSLASKSFFNIQISVLDPA